MEMISAIGLGIFFGFTLQRIGAADPNKIVGMLRLTDTHLIKTILTGLAFSSFLLFMGIALNIIDNAHLSIEPMHTGVVVGAIVLGVGWAISGFCPGTGVTALGTGRKDAFAFVLGGLVGAGVFMYLYDLLAETTLFDHLMGGRTTLVQTGQYEALITDINALVIIGIISFALIIVAVYLPKSLK